MDVAADLGFDPWQILIAAGTLLFSAALVPQLIRTVQLGRADDVSITFLWTVIVASACNMVYFVHLQEWIAASGFIANLIVWPIVLWYRVRPREMPDLVGP